MSYKYIFWASFGLVFFLLLTLSVIKVITPSRIKTEINFTTKDSTLLLRVAGPTNEFYNADVLIRVTKRDTPSIQKLVPYNDISVLDTPILSLADTAVYRYHVDEASRNFRKTYDGLRIMLPTILQLFVSIFLAYFVVRAIEYSKERKKREVETQLLSYEISNILTHARKCKDNLNEVKDKTSIPASIFFTKMSIDDAALSMSLEVARMVNKQRNLNGLEKAWFYYEQLERMKRQKVEKEKREKKTKQKEQDTATEKADERIETAIGHMNSSQRSILFYAVKVVWVEWWMVVRHNKIYTVLMWMTAFMVEERKKIKAKKIGRYRKYAAIIPELRKAMEKEDFLSNFLQFQLTLRNLNRELQYITQLVERESVSNNMYQTTFDLLLSKMDNIERKGRQVLRSFSKQKFRKGGGKTQKWKIVYNDEIALPKRILK